MSKNTEFVLTWPLCRGEERNRSVSKKLDPEWTVKCGWSQNKPYKPDFIEICRNSSSTECLVWGTLSLQVTGSNVLLANRKFVSLLETNCQSTRLQLQYAIGSTRPPQTFYLTGSVIISPDFPDFANGERSGNELLQLSNDLNVLLNPEVPSYADVNLRCGAFTIPAHRSILSARSPLFAAVFAKGLEESQDSHVDIADMDASVLQSMLTFMYTGKTDVNVSQAPDLLHAADMYELQGLKTACGTYLKRNASMDNILNVLVLGDLYDPDLKRFAMDFICDKRGEFPVLRNSQEWQELLSEMPSLVIEVLTSVVESHEKLQTSKA